MDEPMIRAWVQEPAPPDPTSTERPGRWISAPDWPSPVTRQKVLHVAPTGLADAPSEAPVTIDCPENTGHAAASWCMYGEDPDGPRDQNREAGQMVSFETEPLSEDMEIFGFPMLQTRVTCDVPQANLVAVLSLVAPDGPATLISYGVLNLTHRNSHATPEALVPGEAVDATVQLNVIGQRIPAGYRLRLSLSHAYWPVIFPSAQKARLVLSQTRLVLPLHDPAQDGPPLADFGSPEGAAPLKTDVLSDAHSQRTRSIDYPTGVETYQRASDTGAQRHVHTGMTVHYRNEDRFEIHPDDPNTAKATCRWRKSYRRDDWHAEVESDITIEALRDVWRVRARLRATDANGDVLTRDWHEDIARDHV